MTLDIDYVHRLHDAANLGYADISGPPVGSPRVVALVTLYATIIELTHGVVVLTRARSFSSLPSVARSLLEAHVEFQNLAADPDYLKVLDLLDNRQLLTMFKASRGWLPVEVDDSPYDADLQIERLECEVRAAKAAGLKAPDVKERFRLAGLSALYATIYVGLCLHVHVNKSALQLGHHTRDGELLEIAVHDEPAPEIMYSYLTLAACVLRESTVDIYGILDSPLPEELMRVIEEISLRPLAAFGRA